ncbi:MAG TPA: hypothetical protein GXX75_19420 [Clostridiales bacterium]|nr:hypothetical protein [Clostridiales bacterium]
MKGMAIIMLYKKKNQQELSDELFCQPTSEYRGTPFWSWNCKITKELIDEQLEVFKKMGFGGAHLHPRTGLATPYMGEEYLEYIRYTCDRAKEMGMLTWLYDEDRYPSGAAGGLVTEDLELRSRHLVLSRKQKAEMCKDREEFLRQIHSGEKPAGYYVTAYEISLEKGCLSSYRRLSPEEAEHAVQEEKGGRVWYAYLVLAEESPWFNDQTYLDALNKKAVERFIEVTHERYYKAVGDEFGEAIPAIFTDEPHVKGKMTLPFAESEGDVTLVYTDDFSDTFKAQYQVELLDVLPEILWELQDGRVSIHRYHYHDHLTERFVSAYSDTIGEWCEKHKIALTGHFLSERTLFSQTLALGEAMRCYRSFQLPGIDILCDQKELSTAKQAVSVARQKGREGVISELYGVTHWDYGYKGHKLQGDWQAALGVTIRTPHLAFMSMEGEAKRDWPASISYQSPWYETYSYIEDHFARVNTALTRGKAIVKVGVIHPIESFWISYGPNDQTQTIRDQLDANYENLMQWLLYGMVDFDLISEALLPEQCAVPGAPLKVGGMEYDTILVPDCRIIRSTTLDRLEVFARQGGKVIFAGRVPRLVDAQESDRAQQLADRSVRISFNREELLDSLKEDRLIEVRQKNGKLSDNLFYQLRQDNNCRWLFICHVKQKKNRIDIPEEYQLRLKGAYRVFLYDTLKGSKAELDVEYQNGDTLFPMELYGEDSLLLKLIDQSPEGRTGAEDQGIGTATVELVDQASVIASMELADQDQKISMIAMEPTLHKVKTLYGPKGFTLSEPNALLLDYAQYQFNDGEIQPRNEILRIDNEIRSRLGLPRRQDAYKQPWRIPDEEEVKDFVTLYYDFESEIEIKGAQLALERPENAEITFNGEKVTKSPIGYYVDRFIRTLPLPAIKKGSNHLMLRIPFWRKTNLENLYILGDFGVSVRGTLAVLTEAPTRLEFGDITGQGLPFYTGNLTYHFDVEAASEEKETILCVPHFASPVLGLCLDGEDKGLIAFAPHRLSLGKLGKGLHKLDIILYGNRFNGFGTLHNCNDEYMWYGPDSYRTTGSEWSESYGLRPVGILSRVELYER